MQLKQLSHTSFLPQNPYTVHNTSSHILKKGDVINSVNAVLNKKHQTKRDLSYSFFLGGGGGGGGTKFSDCATLYFSALI